MGPVLVVVVQACECSMCVGGLSQHHFPWKKSQKHNQEGPGLRGGWAAHLTTQLKELKTIRKRLAPACLGMKKPRDFLTLLTMTDMDSEAREHRREF